MAKAELPSGYLHVVAAAIVAESGEILLARRADHLHQGGLWEFPGGKVEPGESVATALERELQEELGITPIRIRPLIRVPHRYPDRSVLLDVWRVEQFSGLPVGREGQPIAWVALGELDRYAFPEANRSIVTALKIPDRYLITPDPGPPEQWNCFLSELERSLAAGIELVQLRAKSLSEGDYQRLAIEVVKRCHHRGAKVLLNSRPELVATVGADGVQLACYRLDELAHRPLPPEKLVAASCHNPDELERAERLGVDFALLSPVNRTETHPDVEAMGWEQFEKMVVKVTIPIYALGGMDEALLERAWSHGAQGIAAIRGLWSASC